MNSSQWHPECPNKHQAAIVCLSHNCQQAPFQCQHPHCLCSSVHARCKSMQWTAVQDYLNSWRKFIGKESLQFVSRVDKIFGNLKAKLQKEQKLFEDYCKQNFLGTEYSKLMYLLSKRDLKSITPELLSSALRTMTQPTPVKSFKSFTISELHSIDQSADKLFSSVINLYKSKQGPKLNVDSFKRCSSATLTRDSSSSDFRSKQKQEKQMVVDAVQLKLDLTYPKSINSKIVKQASSLNNILNRKVKKYHHVYRASEEEFSISSFYRKINTTLKQLADNSLKKGQKNQWISLILIKNQHGKILGGYTPLTWQEPKTTSQDSDNEEVNPETNSKMRGKLKFKADTSARTAFFSLDLMEKYELRKPEEAIYCGRRSIGFGKEDLRIVQRGQHYRKSCCKFPSSYNSSSRPYTAWSKSGMELGGGRYSLFFKLVEWQAFVVEL